MRGTRFSYNRLPVRALREMLDLSAEELASALGTNPSELRSVEAHDIEHLALRRAALRFFRDRELQWMAVGGSTVSCIQGLKHGIFGESL